MKYHSSMNNRQRYYLLTLLLVVGCVTVETPEDVLARYIEKLSRHQSMSYNIDYRIKYFSSDDTLKFTPNCRVIRNESDTVFKGQFWITDKTVDRYYDGTHLYVIEHNEQAITRYFPHENQAFPITGNRIGDVLDTYFLRYKKLQKLYEDSTTTFTVGDTLLDNNTLKTLHIHFADEEYLKNQRINLLLNKEYVVEQITYSVDFHSETQFNNWKIKDIAFDTFTAEDLRADFEPLLETYSMNDYEPPLPDAFQPLAITTQAPEFTGEYVHNGNEVGLTDFKGKFVIIDFWYRDCFPCIKAIPKISEMRRSYAESEVVILGLNPIDSQPDDREKLTDFIEINGMNYPTVLVERSVANAYSVKGYPTFYVLNREHKIIFAEVGLQPQLEAKVDSVLRVNGL